MKNEKSIEIYHTAPAILFAAMMNLVVGIVLEVAFS